MADKSDRYPVRFEEEDYKKECLSNINIEVAFTLGGAALGFIAISYILYRAGFPKMRVGDTWISSMWFVAIFFLLFTGLALLRIQRMKKKRYDPVKINAFYETGHRLNGIYVFINTGKRTHYRFYDKNGRSYKVYTRVPYDYQSPKPVVCKAYVIGKAALVYEITKELEEYFSGNEYALEMKEKQKKEQGVQA